MFKHILVPTDLTEKSQKAFDIAVKMALQDERRVTLLHIIESIGDEEDKEFEAFYERLARRAEKIMDSMAEQHRDENVMIDRRIAYGKRARDIVRFADENEIDLIVLSSHRIDRDNPVEGWGTISYRVGILAHCPVMMVK
jgi:nucleotide-binding universal stress UspA family protein